MTCAITRSGMATASSGVFHQMYLLASGFKSSGLILTIQVFPKGRRHVPDGAGRYNLRPGSGAVPAPDRLAAAAGDQLQDRLAVVARAGLSVVACRIQPNRCKQDVRSTQPAQQITALRLQLNIGQLARNT